VPGFGAAQVVRNVVHLSDTPGGGVRRPPPRLGQPTAEVLAALRFGTAEIDDLLRSCKGADEAVIAMITDPWTDCTEASGMESVRDQRCRFGPIGADVRGVHGTHGEPRLRFEDI
jgi:hypothetical protein